MDFRPAEAATAVEGSVTQLCLSIEGRLGHAQAGVLCHECVWGEVVPVGDNPAGGADSHQEGQREPPRSFLSQSH